MSDVKQILDQVSINVDKLIIKQDAYVAEIETCKQENDALVELVETQQQRIKELSEQNNLLQMAKTLAGTEVAATTDVRKKINELVREIDKCISLLNR
ncbi:MAG: hypothetical protein ACJAUV_002167 [Flavobacteriales bacterium]|jgi:hypothetical protein